MSDHPFDHEFVITSQHKERFRNDGFVKLARFLNPTVVDALLGRVDIEMSRPPGDGSGH